MTTPTITRRARSRRPASLAAALAGVAAVTAAAAAPAAARPNLLATSVADPPARIVEGASMPVRDAVANRGTAAGRSATRYYLTSDPARSAKERRSSAADPREALGDLLLVGAREVPALPARGSSAAPAGGKLRVIVPIGTPEGRYRLLACADDRGQVAESVEHDNCRVSARAVRVVAAPGAEDLVSDAFSAIEDRPAEAVDIATLDRRRPAECAPRPPARRMTLAQAIASTKQFLTVRAGADAMAALRAAPESRSAAALEQAAARALIAGRPGAALAALIRAHELRPREASHLENAGAVATSVGLPGEGLAMLEAARLLDDPDPPAMGISRQAVSLANRGHALVALGRFGEAESALGQALAREPYLVETSRTRVVAALCAGGAAAALPHLRVGRVRPGQVDPPLDESQGRESGVRELPLPPSPSEAVRMHGLYQELQRRHYPEILATSQRRQRSVALFQLRPGETRAEWRRRSKIMLRAGAVGLEPPHKTRQAEFLRLVGEASTTDTTFWGATYLGFLSQATKDCTGRVDFSVCYRTRAREMCVPALLSAHQTWLGQMTAAHAARDTAHRALSRQVSAIAANLADPEAHAFGAVVIDEDEHGSYTRMWQEALAWSANLASAAHKDHCLGGVDLPPADRSTLPGDVPAASTGPCPPTLRAFNAVVDLGRARLKINCERIQVEGGVPVGTPWTEAFGEVQYDMRSGSLTLIAGAKAKVGAGPATASFKSGLYLTVGSRGIEDVGWRVGPSFSARVGLAEFKVGDEMNLSFIGSQSIYARQ